MIAFFDTITFLVLLIIAVRQLWRIFTTGKPSTFSLVYIGIFIIYGLPLVYKYTLPEFELGRLPESMRETGVQIQYNFIVLAGIIMLWLTSIRGPASKAKSFKWDVADVEWSRLKFFVWISWFLLFLPLLIIIVFVPNKSAYIIYGQKITRDIYTDLEIFTYGLVTFSVLFSMGGYFVMRSYYYFMTKRAWTIPVVLATLIMFMNIYIHGKRSVLIASLLMLGFFHLIEKRSKKVLYISAVILVTFFFVYLPFGKGYVVTYTGFVRGDLARDYTLDYTIDHSRLTSNDILPHRGNSFIWLATAYIPRYIYTGKGWTTPTYFTCHVFNRSISNRLPWGFGLGYFEEFMLNFGYMGLLLFFPLGLLFRGLDHLIYRRSSIYCVLWAPVLYNLMFASSAALRFYIALVIPVLIIYGFSLRKRRYYDDGELGEPYYSGQLPEDTD